MLRVQLNRTVVRALVYSAVLVTGFVAFSLFYREDLQEIPDRWHGRFFNQEPISSFRSPADLAQLNANTGQPSEPHPIERLVAQADDHFEELLRKQTHGVVDAADAYRRRRGRHPPPFFDKWVAFAESKGSIIIEDFFDRIYDDLNPFWAVPPQEIRASTAGWPHAIKVRNGVSSVTSDEWHFLKTYHSMVRELDGLLPDLDIPVNVMDEPRVLVPWDDIEFFMGSREESMKTQDPLANPGINTYTPWDSISRKDELTLALYGPYWNYFRAGCSPESGVKRLVMDYDVTKPPKFPEEWPNGAYHGFVSNWTLAKDPCAHPHLRNMHGAFVEPISQSTSSKLIPVFGGYKLSVNNDILMPTPYYWEDDDRQVSKLVSVPWEKKRDEVAWRGMASGGRNRLENWTRFHRHRFVSMMNGTQVEQTEQRLASMEPLPPARRPLEEGDEGRPNIDYEIPQNFPMPNHQLYPLKTHKAGKLADWIRSFSNVAFTDLLCFPMESAGSCEYTDRWYKRRQPMSMQHLSKHKIIPDIDGNMASERFRQVLQSNSAAMKATIWNEWHDARLTPWKHFVPMDNTYADAWALLEFLFEHDDYARAVGRESQWWAEQALRKEDMVVYTYRLLLEFARVADPRRQEMGYSDDLHGGEAL